VNYLNILLIGHGAREHAIAQALAKNSDTKLYSIMAHANPGIMQLSENFFLTKVTDSEKICKYALEQSVDFAVMGPEAPLIEGVADALAEVGVVSFGPTKRFAQLEGSKGFARSLMKRNAIAGQPKFRVFTTAEDLGDLRLFVQEIGPCAVKADGVMGGKGVKVWGEHINSVDEAAAWAKEIFDSGMGVVVEEKLEGEEFSLQSITDGDTLLHTPPVQDHKRAFDGDKGPNTGGMGSYSCENHSLPFLSKEDLESAQKITEKVLPAIKRELGGKYVGVLYGGFMATADGVKLIEYNARFGDPETMNTLPLLKNDFSELCRMAVQGNLAQAGELEFAPLASVCKYFVPEGYPDAPMRGKQVLVDKQAIEQSGAKLYYGSIEQREGVMLTTSSRSVAVLGTGKNLLEAEEMARAASAHIRGSVFCRKDIGTAQLIEKRVAHMNKLRG